MYKKNERLDYILQMLKEAGCMKVSELSQRLGASEVTVRKDLDELVRQGLVYRRHGNAEICRNPSSDPSADAKARIGRAAASLVADGDTISIGSGTTCMQVCKALQHMQHILLVTNSIDIVNETLSYKGFTTFLFGGRVDARLRLTVGDEMFEQMDKYLVGKLFFGMDGIDLIRGASTVHHEEKDIMRHLMGRARERYIVADSTKVGKIAFAKIADLDEFDAIITDETEETRGALKQMEEAGIRVIRA